MKKTMIAIEGTKSLDCGLKILRELSRVPKVASVRVALNQAAIEHENTDPELFLKAIRAAGKYQGRIDKTKQA
jgi:hypothetical protein